MSTTTSFASAADNVEQRPRITELAPGVYGYISELDPNCGFVVGEDHVVAIDTRPTPRMARYFLADIATVTDKPVKFIVLSHYHAVRVMGASAFPDVQAIFASRGTPRGSATAGRRTSTPRSGAFPGCSPASRRCPG